MKIQDVESAQKAEEVEYDGDDGDDDGDGVPNSHSHNDYQPIEDDEHEEANLHCFYHLHCSLSYCMRTVKNDLQLLVAEIQESQSPDW